MLKLTRHNKKRIKKLKETLVWRELFRYTGKYDNADHNTYHGKIYTSMKVMSSTYRV